MELEIIGNEFNFVVVVILHTYSTSIIQDPRNSVTISNKLFFVISRILKKTKIPKIRGPGSLIKITKNATTLSFHNNKIII